MPSALASKKEMTSFDLYLFGARVSNRARTPCRQTSRDGVDDFANELVIDLWC